MIELNPIGSIAKTVATGLDALFTSDEERAQAELAIMSELGKPHVLQAMANIEEAKHPSIFVSGWRPFLGWLCGGLLLYAWFLRDILIVLLGVSGNSQVIDKLPVVDASELMTLVFALLGLGASRMYEKTKGVARSGWGDKNA